MDDNVSFSEDFASSILQALNVSPLYLKVFKPLKILIRICESFSSFKIGGF